MRIAYDCRAFRLQAEGGISRYFCDLYRELLVECSLETKICAPLHFNRHLARLYQERLCKGTMKVRLPGDPVAIAKGMKLISPVVDAAGTVSMSLFKPDIHHQTYYSDTKKGAKLVITVFDMIHERFREEFKNPEMTIELKKRAIARADAIICISHSTRSDLVDLYPEAECKSYVVHLGISRDVFFRKSGERELHSEEDAYFLFVGQRGGYKNFERAIAALDMVRRKNRTASLICFGGGDFTRGEKGTISKYNVNVSHVSGGDEELANYYRNAKGLLYTSRYEGFGLPVLEAMACGCPVICSSSSSLPEVGGDAAMRCDVNDTSQIASNIEDLLEGGESRQDLVMKGLRHVERFSLTSCAKKTLSVYTRLI